MALPGGFRGVPGDLIPSGLAAAGGKDAAVAEVLFEQRQSESLAYCRTLASVYALYRAMYADDEAAFLAQPADFAEAVEARRRLAAAENALNAQVSTLLRLGSTATRLIIERAVGYVERLPGVFALVGRNVISPKAGELALSRSRVLTAEQISQFDEQVCERLTREYEVLSLADLKDVADVIVTGIDPEAAERRRKQAVEDRRVTFRADEDGMIAAFALMPAHEGTELKARLDHIAGTVCDQDPRTVGQRQVDGLMQLSRGFSTLGCECEVEGCKYRHARYQGEPDADGVITRFITLINVVLNEQDLPQSETAAESDPVRGEEVANTTDTQEVSADGASVPEQIAADDVGQDAAAADVPAASEVSSAPVPARFGYLEGYGPISAQYARELAARAGAKIRPFGRRISARVVILAEPGLAEPGLAGSGGTPAATGAPTIDDIVHGTYDITPIWNQIILNLPPHTGPHDGGFPFTPDPNSPNGPNEPDGPPGAASSSDPRRPPGLPGRSDPPDDDGGPANPTALRARGGNGVLTSTSTSTSTSTPPIVHATGAVGYRPSTDLRRYLRMLMPRCVFPHCTRPSARAQLDHRREFDHRAPELGGTTTAEQIQPLCIPHHQLKTAGAWIDARLPDGRILWTSPDGRRYIVDPAGVTLTLFPDLARVRWTVPETVVPAENAPPPGGRTRLQREHARRERLRQNNIATLEADIAEARLPPSAVEKKLARVIGAPLPPPRIQAYDGPPPF